MFLTSEQTVFKVEMFIPHTNTPGSIPLMDSHCAIEAMLLKVVQFKSWTYLLSVVSTDG